MERPLRYGDVRRFEDDLRIYPLRNKIRSVAIAPDARTAVIIHERQTQGGDEPLSFFQRQEGITVFDIDTGYRRPIVLQAPPRDIIMTPKASGGSLLFVLLEAADDGARHGILRIDLETFRTDPLPVPRKPEQMGLVAGKIFVAQQAAEGRITFFDVETMTQRTISGYELNAEID